MESFLFTNIADDGLHGEIKTTPNVIFSSFQIVKLLRVDFRRGTPTVVKKRADISNYSGGIIS